MYVHCTCQIYIYLINRVRGLYGENIGTPGLGSTDRAASATLLQRHCFSDTASVTETNRGILRTRGILRLDEWLGIIRLTVECL